MSILEQFIRFGTDSVGLERTLRAVQALLQILISYPFVRELLFFATSFGTAGLGAKPSAETQVILLEARGRVNSGRRWFRTFRFIEAFHGAYKLYVSLAPPPPPPAPPPTAEKGGDAARSPAAAAKKPGFPTEVWLDIFSRSFNGMYLLLETATLLDSLGIQGVKPWGTLAMPLFIESQRFWFFGLACSFLSGLVKLMKVFAYAPVPETGEGYGTGEKSAAAEDEEDDDKPEWEKERERLRRIVTANKERRKRWRKEVRGRSRGLLRKLAADFLDLTIPGAVVGWIRLDPGVVGIAMLGSTYFTGIEVWERCGREVGKA